MAEPKQLKAIKGGLNITKRLLADTEEAGLTAAQRAEAGRKAAELIKSQPQVKASEALGQLMEKGFKKTTTTQADRTRVGGGNIGGAPFPAISEADPAYKGKVWGVMDEGTAARLKNLTDPETAWTTMLGSANQLKTNPIVFDKLKRGFVDSMKQGNLSDELAGKINHNLALTFGEGADIRDPKIWRQADTFEKRAALADVMMGQGTAPSKGGIAIGGEKSGKGVIFKPTDILKRETEPSLLHTEHGGDVPTFAAGPRLFRLNKESVYDPSLHPGFPTLLTGEDLKINMKPTPTEVYLHDWHQRFKKNNPDRKGPGYYDLALGVKGEGLPSQDLNDEYIRHLLREGFKDGGEVDQPSLENRLTKAIANNMAKGGEVNSLESRLTQAIAQHNGMAEGGGAFKKIQFMADGGKLVKGIAQVGKRLLQDAPVAPKVKPPNDNVANVRQANFRYPKTVGNQTVGIDKLSGGVRMSDPNEVKRVKALADQIASPEGYISRIIVDHNDNVIEGQHRLEALRQLGIKDVPVYKIEEMADTMPVDQMKSAVQSVGAIHPDHVGQIINHALESIASEGVEGARQMDLGRFQKHYDAALNAITPDIKKAHGGIAHMDKGGKAGKLASGIANVGKRLMADNSLPALEREANLQRFLAESKTPMRLYHGTTATEGGKGAEAIRRIKPSKEGALGSGVYTTPNTAHASSYTGIPNDDAIEAMRGSEYYSKMADQFMADRAAGRLREGQAGGNMLPVHVQMRNPLIIGKSGRNIDPAADALMSLGMDEASAIRLVEKAFEDKGNIGKQIQTRAQAQGYDGIMQYRGDDLSEVVSYRPNAVKSAIGNRGTYDINEPDLSKAHGGLAHMDKGGKAGKVVSGLASVGKRLLADAPVESPAAKQMRLNMMPTARIGLEAPGILIPSKMNNVREAVRNIKGNYGARRVERAADEIPNLEKMYKEDALKEAFTGDNASAMITLSPAEFERYAAELTKRSSVGPKMAELAKQGDIDKMTVPTDEYIKHLQRLQGGFDDVPYLNLFKDEVGIPTNPKITGHEGRHRSRALAESGAPSSLVKINPRGDLREGMPRRTQEDFIEALREELELSKRLVIPESEPYFRRPNVKLPDVYAKGGLSMAGGGSIQDNLKKIQNYSVLDQGAPRKPNELGGVVLAGASWMAGDEKTKLAKQLFGEEVTNTAIGGQKTSDVLKQLNEFKGNGGTFAPNTTVVLDIGANDIAQGVDESVIRNNLNEIVSRLGDEGVHVILSGQPEAHSYDEAIKSTTLRMDDLYSDIASNNPNVTLVDAMSGMLNDKSLMDESGFHLNSDEAKLAYLSQFADANKARETNNQSVVDIPQEIAQITQTDKPAERYTPEAQIDFMPAVVESEPSAGYTYAQNNSSIDNYYNVINDYLAQERTQDEIQAAMEQYGVSQADVDAARDYQPSGGKFDESYATEAYANGGSAFKKIQFMDKGGVTTSAGSFSPEELGVTANDLRLIDDKTLQLMKKNAPATYEWAKQNVKDEANQLKTAKGMKDFALRVGASYAGALPDFANLLLMAPDAVFGTELASEKPWFGSQQYLDAMNKAGMLGENEFPIAETVAGILTPAGLIKKGVKKVGNMRTSKETPKKRQGGLTAMAR